MNLKYTASYAWNVIFQQSPVTIMKMYTVVSHIIHSTLLPKHIHVYKMLFEYSTRRVFEFLKDHEKKKSKALSLVFKISD